MTGEESRMLNDALTELTGIKHYASVEEMFEAKFSKEKEERTAKEMAGKQQAEKTGDCK